MKLGVALTLYQIAAGGPGSGCHGPNCGRPPGHGGVVFISPNIKENLSFDQAKRALSGPRHRQIRKMAEGVLQGHASAVRIKDGIGDWSDGAENTLFITARIKDRDELRYVAAEMGDKAQQKAVIPFEVTSKGKDSVWTIKTQGGSMEQMRSVLDKSGLAFRTFEPGSGETSIHVFDPGSGLGASVQKAAVQLGGQLSVVKGRGEFLGGDTRADGSKAYHEVIDNYEKGHRHKMAASAKKKSLQLPVVDNTEKFLASGQNSIIIMGAKKSK